MAFYRYSLVFRARGPVDRAGIEEVMRRADSLEQQTLSYRLLSRNCENMANYVRYGISFSAQGRNILLGCLLFVIFAILALIGWASSAIDTVRNNWIAGLVLSVILGFLIVLLLGIV